MIDTIVSLSFASYSTFFLYVLIIQPFAVVVNRFCLVGGLGIEPSSSALQADAGITRLAHPPKTFRIVLFQQ